MVQIVYIWDIQSLMSEFKDVLTYTHEGRLEFGNVCTVEGNRKKYLLKGKIMRLR